MTNKESGIYSITSRINGKRYIGSAIRISTRWYSHKYTLRNNKHHSKYLQNHYNKYGEEDLIFDILEIVERKNLTLKDFRQLLLDKEQTYLNNWSECQFNCSKNATSFPIGKKIPNSKYYLYNKKQNLYLTRYTINGKLEYFRSHILEKDAISEVEYIKTLSEDNLIKYYKECKTSRYKNSKSYSYDKKNDLYKTYYIVKGKSQHFSCHSTEKDAIEEINYIKSLNEDELFNYLKECRKRPSNYRKDKKERRKRGVKGFYYNKVAKIWYVQFKIDKKVKSFGCYKIKEEAIKKANEIKLELGLQ